MESTGTGSGEDRVVVVAAVIERDGKFLLAQRSAGTNLADLWEFPGGKVEPGETLNRALHREIQEELGVEITVRDEEPVKTVSWDYDHARVVLVALRADIIGGEPRPLDHAALRWFSPAELSEADLLPADRPVAFRLQAAAGVPPITPLSAERSGRQSTVRPDLQFR